MCVKSTGAKLQQIANFVPLYRDVWIMDIMSLYWRNEISYLSLSAIYHKYTGKFASFQKHYHFSLSTSVISEHYMTVTIETLQAAPFLLVLIESDDLGKFGPTFIFTHLRMMKIRRLFIQFWMHHSYPAIKKTLQWFTLNRASVASRDRLQCVRCFKKISFHQKPPRRFRKYAKCE